MPHPSTPTGGGSSRALTKSALDAHDRALAAADDAKAPKSAVRRPGHRISMPVSPPLSVSSRSPQTPTALPLSSFPMTPTTTPSNIFSTGKTSRRASLSASQAHAHAVGFTNAVTTKPTKYFPLPTPTEYTRPSVRTPPALYTISEVSSNSNAPTSVSVIPPSSRPSPHRRATMEVNTDQETSSSSQGTKFPSTPGGSSSGREHLDNVNSKPYFDWKPGKIPMPFYDPDYPTGSPKCISPRVRTTSSGKSNESVKDYFSRPVRRRSSSKSPRQSPAGADLPTPGAQVQTKKHRSRSSSPVIISTELVVADKQPVAAGNYLCLDVASDSPSPPTSTKYSTPTTRSANDDVPLTISEVAVMHGNLGAVNDIFGHIVGVDEDGSHIFGTIPWPDMQRAVRRRGSREPSGDEHRKKRSGKERVRDKEEKERKRKELEGLSPTKLIMEKEEREYASSVSASYFTANDRTPSPDPDKSTSFRPAVDPSLEPELLERVQSLGVT